MARLNHGINLHRGLAWVSRKTSGDFRQLRVVAAPPRGAVLAEGVLPEPCEGASLDVRAMYRAAITNFPSMPVLLVTNVRKGATA